LSFVLRTGTHARTQAGKLIAKQRDRQAGTTRI